MRRLLPISTHVYHSFILLTVWDANELILSARTRILDAI